jgi:HEAT repeat protein
MMPYSESISYLIEYIAQDHDDNKDHRYLARKSLIRIGEPAIAPLIESLRKENGSRLNNILGGSTTVITQIGKPSIPYLANALRDTNLTVKSMAVAALSHFKEAEAGKYMVNALYDKQLQYDTYGYRQYTVEGYLKQMGNVAVEPLLLLLKADDPDIRFSALKILGAIGEKKALKPLIKAIKYEKLKRPAIEALGGIKDRRAVRALIKLLKDDATDIRAWAVDALGSIGNKQAVPPLLELLETGKMTGGIIVALGKIGDRKIAHKIVPFLCDHNSQMRIVAAAALLNIAAPNSAAALVNALDDEEPIVRGYACEALRKITKVDCGYYSDTWRLWLERNRIPEIKEPEEETGILKQIYLFLNDLLWDIWIWF